MDEAEDEHEETLTTREAESVPDAVVGALGDLKGSIESLGERVARLEASGVKTETEQVHEVAPAVADTIEEPPPAVIVEHHIETSPLRKFHDAVG